MANLARTARCPDCERLEAQLAALAARVEAIERVLQPKPRLADADWLPRILDKLGPALPTIPFQCGELFDAADATACGMALNRLLGCPTGVVVVQRVGHNDRRSVWLLEPEGRGDPLSPCATDATGAG